MRLTRFAVIAGLVLAAPLPAFADTASVAVAANFTEAAKEIAAAFAEKTDHEAQLSFGATGALYTQVTQGAPFQVFLAADDERPTLAVTEGYGVEGSVFTYAVGKLALYSAGTDVTNGEAALKAGGFEKIAIANPETAPYGAAAVEAMEKLGVYDALKGNIVQGQSIAQAFQFVETGNAELGFVALAQVINATTGSRWDVPQDLYTPIRQDAVLLKTGADDPAATAFVDFLKTDEAKAIIAKYGYGLDAGA
jgi:molybdate transport system substrate-binding protein